MVFGGLRRLRRSKISSGVMAWPMMEFGDGSAGLFGFIFDKPY